MKVASDPVATAPGSDTISLRIGGGEVTLFGADEQLRQSPRWVDRHFDLVPFAVSDEVLRLEANRILVSQLQRDLLEDVVHFSAAARIERLAAGYARQFIESALALHAERAAHIAAAQNSDRI